MQLLSEPERERIKEKAGKIVPIFKNPLSNIFFFETFGSLILVYGICVTQYLHPISRQIPNPFWTFLISCFNFLAISIAGLFTGGHINPVATIGLWSAGLVQRRRLPAYLLSQLVGSILGTLICKQWVSIDYAFFQENPHIYDVSPQFSEIILDCISEAIGTFIFVFAVLHVTVREYMKGEPFQFFFISLMLLVARTYFYPQLDLLLEKAA